MQERIWTPTLFALLAVLGLLLNIQGCSQPASAPGNKQLKLDVDPPYNDDGGCPKCKKGKPCCPKAPDADAPPQEALPFSYMEPAEPEEEPIGGPRKKDGEDPYPGYARVLVVYSQPGCQPCARLHAALAQDDALKAEVAARWTLREVNDAQTAAAAGVKAYPTMHVNREKDGQVVNQGKMVGYKTAGDLLKFLKKF